jgi:hypothetical protein
MNQRGAVRADGMQEFNPDAGVKLSRKSEAIAAENKTNSQKKGGCCN